MEILKRLPTMAEVAAARGFTPNPKPTRKARKQDERRESRDERDHNAEISAYVKGRERGICRCCRLRPGQSRHEIVPRGAGGKVTKKNAIWVCGLLVHEDRCCHTYLQEYAISVEALTPKGADGDLLFTPKDEKSAEWLKVTVGRAVLSGLMQETESIR